MKKPQNEFEERKRIQLKTIIIAWACKEVAYGSIEKVFLEAIRETHERGMYDALSPTDRKLNKWSWEKK